MKKINKTRKEEFISLYNQGYNDYAIARRMNISDSTIFRWRRSMNLAPIRNKELSKNKEVTPTQEQIEILAGTLLGDSSLQYYPKYRWKTPKFKCDHGAAQEEYANLLYNKLQSLGSSIKRYNRIDKRNGKEYITYCVCTSCNPYFFSMYNQLYSTGKKEICSDFLKNFTIKSLAYLYMDDGYADQKTAFICTDNFSDESRKTLVKHIESKFNLHFSIVNHGKYYRLRLSQYDFPRFKELIEPYMIESLKYKLRTVS